MAQPAEGKPRIFAVAELVRGLNVLLADRVGRIWVVGQVSNLRRVGSGHSYFSLVDADAQVKAVLFRGAAQRTPFELEEGMEVLVYTEVNVYEARGDLQLVVRQVEPRGKGALQMAFEQLRRSLEEEGLFDPANKRELPRFPRRIGVVTSATGAALRDVIEVSGRRFPSTPLRIASTRVQGDGAPREIVAALGALERHGDVDVILLVRGGGSLEDLQAFNSEQVARAVAYCQVPIVCGVGHETDVTIADLVADVRAATPSAAAMQVTPDGPILRRQLARDFGRLAAAMRGQIERARGRLSRERDALRMLAPAARLAAQRARLASLQRALLRVGAHAVERRRALAAQLVGRLDSLSPLAVLSRGYALVRRASDGAILVESSQTRPGDAIAIRLGRGELEATVARVVESSEELD